MNTFSNTLAISGVIRDIPKRDAKGNYVCQGTIHFSPGTKIFILPPLFSYDM
jgi:stalled ribosome rescue protein Dom34